VTGPGFAGVSFGGGGGVPVWLIITIIAAALVAVVAVVHLYPRMLAARRRLVRQQ
jgi:hypothetical protein